MSNFATPTDAQQARLVAGQASDALADGHALFSAAYARDRRGRLLAPSPTPQDLVEEASETGRTPASSAHVFLGPQPPSLPPFLGDVLARIRTTRIQNIPGFCHILYVITYVYRLLQLGRRRKRKAPSGELEALPKNLRHIGPFIYADCTIPLARSLPANTSRLLTVMAREGGGI
jgi:hypothetical protein